MRKYAAAAALAVLVAWNAPGAHAQKKQRAPSTAQEIQSLREQVRELQEGQESIQKDLQEIKRLLMQVRAAAPPPPQGPPMPTSVSLDTDPHLGSDTAKVVMIDFSDYQ